MARLRALSSFSGHGLGHGEALKASGHGLTCVSRTLHLHYHCRMTPPPGSPPFPSQQEPLPPVAFACLPKETASSSGHQPIQPWDALTHEHPSHHFLYKLPRAGD